MNGGESRGVHNNAAGSGLMGSGGAGGNYECEGGHGGSAVGIVHLMTK